MCRLKQDAQTGVVYAELLKQYIISLNIQINFLHNYILLSRLVSAGVSVSVRERFYCLVIFKNRLEFSLKTQWISAKLHDDGIYTRLILLKSFVLSFSIISRRNLDCILIISYFIIFLICFAFWRRTMTFSFIEI